MAPRNEPLLPPPPGLQRPAPGRYLSTASKRSFRSHSSSVFEADDERSPSPHRSFASADSMDRESSTASGSTANGHGHGRGSGSGSDPPGRYPGEDTRPTSSRELAGWYMYAFASETYVICGTLSPGRSLLALCPPSAPTAYPAR